MAQSLSPLQNWCWLGRNKTHLVKRLANRLLTSFVAWHTFMAIILSTTWASVTAALALHTIGISHFRKAAQFLLSIHDCCRLGGDIEELNCHTEPEPNLVFGTLWLKIHASCFLPSQKTPKFCSGSAWCEWIIWHLASYFFLPSKVQKCFMMWGIEWL